MKKEIVKYSVLLFSYFLFLVLFNKLFSFSYWPLYLGALVGLLLSFTDHILHVFVFKPYELTSIRIKQFIKQKQFKNAILLLYDTKDERKDLIFHTLIFQIIFLVLTFWIITSSGNYFVKGLVLSYFLSICIYSRNKLYILALLIFAILI